jgi:hypothetical protein
MAAYLVVRADVKKWEDANLIKCKWNDSQCVKECRKWHSKLRRGVK